MSWIKGSKRIEKAVGTDNALGITKAINAGRTETWVVRTMPDGSTKVQVLDTLGNFKPLTVDVSKILKVSNAGAQP